MKSKIIVLFITIVILFFACEEEKVTTETQLLFEGGDSAFVFKDVSSLYSENALLKLKLEAPTQIQYNNQDQLFPDGLYLELFDEKGNKTTILEADWAKYEQQIDKYTATGNVLVKNLVENQQLETPVLHWNKKDQKIYSDTTVVITTKQEQITGIGMSARQDFSQYIIREPTGIITLPKDFQASPQPRRQYLTNKPQPISKNKIVSPNSKNKKPLQRLIKKTKPKK